jgi:hypothetical protein
MPPAILRAFADHGQARGTLGESSGAAEQTLRDAQAAGVDLDAIAAPRAADVADSALAGSFSQSDCGKL